MPHRAEVHVLQYPRKSKAPSSPVLLLLDFQHVVQALQNLVLLDECWNSNSCTAHMLLHPISRHPMSSRVTRPSPWKIFRICSQLHHFFSGIAFPSMWFLRVPWSRFLYLCHDNVPVSHFQARSIVIVIQELDTKCFRRAKDTPRTQCNSTCSRGVWRRPCPNRTPTEVSLSSFRCAMSRPFSVFLKTGTPHTSFFSCRLHIYLHAYHTAWLKGSRRATQCVCSAHSFHRHAIHDVCLSVVGPRSVLLLFLSVVYLFSSTLYLYSAWHSIFNVDTAEGQNHCAFAQ